ncbi:MAG: hypothetical protein Kow00129_00880 [Thermoleophilia bacterium]
MTDVVGVAFNKGGKVYYFDPADLHLTKGDQVVVQTMRGTEVGEVVDPPHEVPDEEIPAPLKRVVRVAGEEDLRVLEENAAFKHSALRTCRELIEKHGLDMKLVDAEVAFGGGKITFSFFAEERVDFRALVAELARALKMRIELRQIGAREEAKLIGGLGPCGRNLCCRSFQVSQDPVSIRMAKEQQLPLTPSKISGLCGRLMCCLKYEQDQYVGFRKEVPGCGSLVETSAGEGKIVAHKVPKDAVTVRFEDGSERDFPIVNCNCGEEPCRVVERCAREEDEALVAALEDGSAEQDFSDQDSGEQDLAERDAASEGPRDGGSANEGASATADGPIGAHGAHGAQTTGARGNKPITIRHGERPEGSGDGDVCTEPVWQQMPNDDSEVDPATLGDDVGKGGTPGGEAGKGADDAAVSSSSGAGGSGSEEQAADSGGEERSGGNRQGRSRSSRRRKRRPRRGGGRAGGAGSSGASGKTGGGSGPSGRSGGDGSSSGGGKNRP